MHKGATATAPRPRVSLPKLVGESKSGVTRLSELKSRKTETSLSSGSTSKFFHPQSMRTTAAKSESIIVDLVFDDEPPDDAQNVDDAPDLSDPGVATPEAHERALTSMPPSPVCSTYLSSPVKAESAREESPLSSPENLPSHTHEQRSTHCLTSPFDPATDGFDANSKNAGPISGFANAVGPTHPPTPSPSDDGKSNDNVIPTAPSPALSESGEEEQEPSKVKQEQRREIDFTPFFQTEGMESSPIAVESDIETEVEETQQDLITEQQREQESVKAVAAGWKAKFTFGGM
ncbi:hypothetical protein QFC22_002850, partial [Naganishia vaughanmartiniae]